MRLGPVEGRIIGSLIEKQLTTPQQYPLTLNALVLACNQSSNRDPVVSYDERTVEAALASLKEAGVMRFVLPSHGRSVVRYRQVLHENLALDERQMALVGVLLLRGPQTVGELRARTERMAGFGGIDEVESDLEGLARRPDALVVRMARRPGQKEERWAQLLEGEPTEWAQPDRAQPDRSQPETPRPEAAGPEAARPEAARPETLRPETAQPAGAEDDLRAEVAALRQEVAALRHEVAALHREGLMRS
jgi:hypothetical protein